MWRLSLDSREYQKKVKGKKIEIHAAEKHQLIEMAEATVRNEEK